MPPALLIDLDGVDLNRVVQTREQIYEHLPHRHEFMLLDGICHLDAERRQGIAFCDVREDAWWFRGHVPGRPLMPGVLMLEVAAHMSAVLAKISGGYGAFIGFGGVEACKFRDTVTAPSRLYILCQGTDYRRRRITSNCQGVVDGRLVFEATIIGLTMP